MQGPDAKDPTTLRHPPDDPLPTMKRGVAGLRLATLPAPERDGIDAEVLEAFDESIALLAGLGAQIVEVTLPRPLKSLAAVTGRIIGAEGYSFVGDLVDDMDLPIDEAVRPRIWLGKDMSAREYLLTLREREQIKGQFDAALADVDAWLTPTTATPAIPVDAVDQGGTPAQLTRAVNVLDRCALSVPNGFTAGGLPTSLQIICRAYDEATALRVGWAYQQATDWHLRHPPLD